MRKRVALLPIYPTLQLLPIWREHYRRSVKPVVDEAYAYLSHAEPALLSAARSILEDDFQVLVGNGVMGDGLTEMTKLLPRAETDVLCLEDDLFMHCDAQVIEGLFDELSSGAVDVMGPAVVWASPQHEEWGRRRFSDWDKREDCDTWGCGILPTMLMFRMEALEGTDRDFSNRTWTPDTNPFADFHPTEPTGTDAAQWMATQLRLLGRKLRRLHAGRMCPWEGNLNDYKTLTAADIASWPWMHTGLASYFARSILVSPQASMCPDSAMEVPSTVFQACLDLQGHTQLHSAIQKSSWMNWELFEQLRALLVGYLKV
jgi:hypothetical protein